MRRIESRDLSRRDFLKIGSAAIAAAPFIEMACKLRPDIPVGMQLYCVRNECATDFAGTLEQLAGMGYVGVEFADYFGRTAKELRKMLDDNGLRSCGTHIYLNTLQGDELQKSIDYNLEVGTQNLIVRWLNEEQHNTMDALLKTAEEFNEAAVSLKPHGLRIGYHNHGFDFETIGAETKWNILADNTSKDVILQLDTGNASSAGADVNVIQLLNRNPGRTVTIHVKPYSSVDDNALLGDDELDWHEIFKSCESTGGTEWYIIEYEKEGIAPLQAMKMNLDNMRRMRT